MPVRPEQPSDIDSIRTVTAEAFARAPHASGTEPAIIDALRQAGALHLSLVAEENGGIIGHVAFSPVLIAGKHCGWFGLGPVSVRPIAQGQGIGSALIREGLDRLRSGGAAGCVLLGDPRYYRRFGFRADPALILPGMPPDYVLSLRLGTQAMPRGVVTFHAGFDATG